MDVSENGGFSPQNQIIHFNRVFSMIFTIHFGGNTPILGNTHMYLMQNSNVPCIVDSWCIYICVYESWEDQIWRTFEHDIWYVAMSEWKLWNLGVPEVPVPFKTSTCWIMLTKDCNHQYKSRSCVKKFKSTSTNSCLGGGFKDFWNFHQPVFLDEKSSTNARRVMEKVQTE